MNELITVNYDNNRPTVLGRDLHELLEVQTPYHKWFPRMAEYGFIESVDYMTMDKNVLRSDGVEMPQTQKDHQLTIEMAKELCMLQRTEKGKQARQYFIELEKAWNSPEKVMARALQIANQEIESLKLTNAVQQQQIAELNPKATYYDLVLQCSDLVSATVIAKDYGKSAKWLNKVLADNKVQFKQGGIWVLYKKYAEKGYTQTKTDTYVDHIGISHTKPHTHWTQKGRLFIYDFLKDLGYLPIVERQQEEK
jgi:anti-repressor protein